MTLTWTKDLDQQECLKLVTCNKFVDDVREDIHSHKDTYTDRHRQTARPTP